MKKSIVLMASLILVSGAMFIGCNSPSQRVKNAEDKVIEANEALDKANREYLAEMESYRKKTAETIIQNEKDIAALRERIKGEKREARIAYENQIALLEQKNHDMLVVMDNYKADGKDNWEHFKIEFNRDMDELNTALKNLTINNTK